MKSEKIKTVSIIGLFFIFILIITCSKIKFDNPYDPEGTYEGHPVIEIKGGETITLQVGDDFNPRDLISVKDDKDNNLDIDITAKSEGGDIVEVNYVTKKSGEYTIYYNVTDSDGNEADTKTTIVIVQGADIVDSIKPVITLIGDDTLELDMCGQLYDSGATAQDNIDGDLTDSIKISGDTAIQTCVVGVYSIIYTVSDFAGNTATAVRTVIVLQTTGKDETAPEVTLVGSNPDTVYIGDVYEDPGATAMDNRDGNITDNIKTFGTGFSTSEAGSAKITYSVSDAAGNVTIVDRTILILEKDDPVPPIITITGDNPTIICIGQEYIELGATAYDSVDGDITSNIITTGEVNTSLADTYTVTYTVEDAWRNEATADRIVIVSLDSEAPEITLIGANPYSISVGGSYDEPGATATDNVDGDISASITTSGSVDVNTEGEYTITYTVFDAAGNEATATRIVNVTGAPDTTAPDITIVGANPMNHTVGTPYNDQGATAVDDFDGDLTVSITTSGSVDVNTEGEYTITYTVFDAAGNEATATRIVNVTASLDTTAPEIIILGINPVNITIGTPYIDSGATAFDDFDGNITTSIVTDNTVDVNTEGSYTVTYTVSDAAGNEATATRTVNVEPIADTEPPEITLNGDNPMNIYVGEAYNEPNATATDNVDGDLTASIVITGSVDINTEGTYTITYTVSDAAENEATETRTVNVTAAPDTEAPIITLIGANPMSINVGDSYTEPGATAIDSVDGDLTANIAITGTVDTSKEGSYMRTYKVSDAAGNEASVSRVINVTSEPDVTKPVITLLGDNPMNISVGDSFIDPGATAVDDFDGDISGNIEVSGVVNTNSVGSYTLTYKVSDAAGNRATEYRTVKINPGDSEAPVITLIGNNPMNLIVGETYNEPGATANDNTDGDISGNIEISSNVNTSAEGTYTVNYTVSDAAGNQAQKTRTVNVAIGEDTEPPEIILQGNNPMNITLGDSYIEPGATATDNVDGDVSSSIQTSGNVDTQTEGTYTITYTVSDAAGNEATATRTVNVSESGEDTEAPVITILGDNPMELIVGDTYIDPGATATDNFDGDVSSSIQTSGNVDTQNEGTYTITYTVSDAAGNEATATRTVNVALDTEAPVITILGDNPMSLLVGDTYNEPGATATDNVDGNVSTSIQTSGNVDTQNEGTYTITYTVSDAAGNEATATRTVNVSLDTEAPVITIIGDNPMSLLVGDTYNEPGATATDNIDGDISASIQTSGNVDTQNEGTYTITYTVSDAAGNEATATRTVNVTEITDDEPPVITIIGDNPMNLLVGDTYNEPGATATDNIDGDISASIQTSGNVDTQNEGTYTITYTVSDAAGNEATKTRTVNVTEITDDEPPVITIIGDNPMYIDLGGAYTEEGASANDNVDGNITPDIETSGEVNTDTAGEYKITYEVADAAGNSTIERRTVFVVDYTGGLLIEDFETGGNKKTTIAELYFSSSDGYWFGYDDNNDGCASTITPDPADDKNFEEIVAEGEGYDGTMGMHVTYVLKSSGSCDYPYAGLGFNLKTANKYYDLSNLDNMTFYAKGDGTIRVQFLTEVVDDYPAGQDWGHLGVEIDLTSSWTKVTILPEDLEPAPYSPQEQDGLTWEDVKSGVVSIHFKTTGESGTIELSLDDIRMDGVRLEDILAEE